MKSRTKSIGPARLAEGVRVQLSLPVAGVLQDVQSAFFGLCIDAGKAVLGAMMETERTALCGPKGCPDASRSAYRGGHARSQVVLGGRRIGIARPRARAVAAGELSLPTFTWAASADPLNRATIAAIAAGVSTRRYERTLDPLPANAMQSAASKSAVSRRFVALSSAQLAEWLSRRIDTIDLPVVMIDGIYFRDRVVLIALGFDSQGKKHVLGIREGSTEKTQVVKALLSELIDRGLNADRMRLWVIDGAKALRRAITENLRRQRSGATLPGPQAQKCARALARGNARQRGPGAGRCLGQQQRRARQAPARTTCQLAGERPSRSGCQFA